MVSMEVQSLTLPGSPHPSHASCCSSRYMAEARLGRESVGGLILSCMKPQAAATPHANASRCAPESPATACLPQPPLGAPALPRKEEQKPRM